MSWQKIDHVVVLMMENQSFDRVLGWMTPEEHGVDGVRDGLTMPVEGELFPGGEDLAPLAGANLVPPGAPHLPRHIFQQLHDNPAGPNKGFGFVMQDHVKGRSLSLGRRRDLVQEVARFHRMEDLPTYAALATSFGVADRWFSPIGSSTWPNRYFLHYGTSPTGKLHAPQLDPSTPTIFERLNDAGLSWRIYRDGPANLHMSRAVIAQARRAETLATYRGLSGRRADVIRSMDRFLCDIAQSKSNTYPAEVRAQLAGTCELDPDPWPTYTFIEPRHMNGPKSPANNDHSGHHLHHGQRLVATIYNALRSDPELFERTLFVLSYDEHGGYYDHVAPPPAPDPRTGRLGDSPTNGAMDWYGARVPTFLVSPWIKRGAYHTVCDHTSVLSFLETRFGLRPLTYRDAMADDLTAAFGSEYDPGPERLELPPIPVETDELETGLERWREL